MEKRYGRRMQIELKAVIKENGTTKTVFFEFPRQVDCFDRPANVFYYTIEWFRTMFPTIDSVNLATAILRHDDGEKEKIMRYIIEGIKTDVGGRK